MADNNPSEPAPSAPVAAMVAQVPATVQQVATEVKKSAEVALQTATSWLKGPMLAASLLFFAAAIAILFLLFYSLFWYINRNFNERKRYMLPGTDTPLLGTEVNSLNADKVPNPKNGRRMTMTFWIYIYDIDKFTGRMRHVLHRGDRVDGWEKGSPAVFLDKELNKLHFTLGSEKPDPLDGHKNTLTASMTQTEQIDNKLYEYIRAARGVTIDYIPLQRWVHVAFVVNEEVNGGTITAYVDSELVKVVTDEKPTRVPYTASGRDQFLDVRLNIRHANMGKKGNVFVGGATSDDGLGPGFSGLVSRVTFFNYDLNSKDVFAEYSRGPSNAMMSALGLPGYGVRSPLYRLG